MQELDDEPGDFLIDGAVGFDFDPPVLLNDLDWFPVFFRKQSNFSFGFNRIIDPLVVEALIALRASRQSSADDTELPDVDLSLSVIEGAPRLVSHFRRERSRRLVEAKKAAVRAERGTLACEACGFDFSHSYGSWACNFCEIHHRLALAESASERTMTLGDLAVLCSNCHRVIHRVDPMPTVEQLASHIRKQCV